MLIMDDTIRARVKIEQAIESALDGRIGYIEAARAVRPLLKAAGFDRLSEPFSTFVAIDSETDTIPVGEMRDLRKREGMTEEIPEWDRAEAWAKEFGEPAFREALAPVRKAVFPNFLESFAGLERVGFTIRKAEYWGHVFGSWSIEFSSETVALHRLVWDRRERWLVLQCDPPADERNLWNDRWTGREPCEWSLERALSELPGHG